MQHKFKDAKLDAKLLMAKECLDARSTLIFLVFSWTVVMKNNNQSRGYNISHQET